MAVLSRTADAELRAAKDSLWRHRSEVGVTAENSFYLAVAIRYLDYDHAAYSALMDEALQCDPNFTEALIARRSGVDYVDPYCYPTWTDLTTGVARPRPMPDQPDSSYAYVDLVRCGNRVVSAVFVYVTTADKFRTTLTDATAATVSVDILAIPPSLSAMMHVLPVIFDDLNDPFWKSIRLNLYPSVGDLHGIEIRQPEDYDPMLGRNIATRFCAAPHRCCLMVLAAGRMILARMIEPEPDLAERYAEMAAVLRLLPDETVHPMVWHAAMKFHGDNFVTEVSAPNGRLVRVPRGRDPAVAEALLLPITTYNNRLATKAWVDAQITPRVAELDIFISHAHADSRWAANVEKWLLALWPALRIVRTEPGSGTEYADLTSFFKLLSQARCVLLLATPRAICRPAVGAELGAAGYTVVLLADGATEDDLLKLATKEPFIKMDFDLVCNARNKEGWHKLASCLASRLQIQLPASLPPGPPVPKSNSATSVPDAMSNFVDDFAGTFTRHPGGGGQTEAEAIRLLEVVQAELARKHGPQFSSGATGNLLPRTRLLALALSLENENGIVEILKHFPALLDTEFSGLVKTAVERESRKPKSEVDLDMLQRLHLISRYADSIAAGQLTPKQDTPAPSGRFARMFKGWFSK